jgi:hypothetical protein
MDVEINNVVDAVQKYAELTHCASALLGTENYLLDHLKEKGFSAETKKRLTVLKEKIRNANKEEDFAKFKKYNAQLKKLMKPGHKIQISYASTESETAGRLTSERDGRNTIYTITLPIALKVELDTALKRNPKSDVWQEEGTRRIKRIMQETTLHEVIHILLSDNTSKDETVIEAAAKEWREKRANRNHAFYCSPPKNKDK